MQTHELIALLQRSPSMLRNIRVRIVTSDPKTGEAIKMESADVSLVSGTGDIVVKAESFVREKP